MRTMRPPATAQTRLRPTFSREAGIYSYVRCRAAHGGAGAGALSCWGEYGGVGSEGRPALRRTAPARLKGNWGLREAAKEVEGRLRSRGPAVSCRGGLGGAKPPGASPRPRTWGDGRVGVGRAGRPRG